MVLLLIPAMFIAACGSDETEPGPAGANNAASATSQTPAPTATQTDVPRNAYLGDTHFHIGWSADAGMDGAILSPDDAYRFALGEKIKSNTGMDAQLGRPYDRFMVTDHSDGMGVISEIVSGNAEMMANETPKRWSEDLNSGDEERAATSKSELILMQSEERLPEQLMDPKWMKSAWAKTIDGKRFIRRIGQIL